MKLNFDFQDKQKTRILKMHALISAIFFMVFTVIFAILCIRHGSISSVIGLIGSTIVMTYYCFKVDALYNIFK